MLKADFHVHTHYSKCSDMKPRDFVKMALKKSYNVLGVVDHNSIKGGIETKKIAGKKILVIPGEEIKTNYGEIIVFLSDGKYNRSLIDICERAKKLNNFIVIPHPFDFLRIRTCLRNNMDKIKDSINAVEVFNSRVMISLFNKNAERYAIKNKIPKIAGSDAHFMEEIGNVECFLNCERNVDSVLDYLQKDKMKFKGKMTSPLSHLKSNISLPLSRLLKL